MMMMVNDHHADDDDDDDYDDDTHQQYIGLSLLVQNNLQQGDKFWSIKTWSPVFNILVLQIINKSQHIGFTNS